MHLHVCSLARLDATFAAIRPNRIVSLVMLDPPLDTPAGVDPEHHLRLSFHDIAAPIAGHVAPDASHVRRLIDFARGWDRASPMLIHCFAGISRSTAACYAVACALQPHVDETRIALALRAASPSATPNPRIVALADAALGRDGRMVAAARAIGRGADAYEGAPFRFDLDEA
jgi:predicted protein tyrosine phosphatase